MIKNTFIRIVCLSVLNGIFVFLSCGGDKTKTEQIIRPVRYTEVYSTGGSRIRTFSGVARAGVESKLSFKVAGTINRVAVKLGDNVKSGQTIAELDKRDYRLQVQEAEASLEQAQALARNSFANYDRERSLYENNNASLNDLDAARTADESARALVRSIEKRLELAQLQLEYATLKAPVDGAIAAVEIEVNENIKIGNTVAILTAGTRLEVDVAIPEILITDIREGDKVSVSFDAFPSDKFPAVISEVSVSATGPGTTFPVTVILNNEDDRILPGMAAQTEFRLKSGDDRERYIVPSVSVGEDREGRFVYIVERDESGYGIVHRKPVTIGDLTERGLEIFEGLSDRDLVITAGLSKLTEGLKVKLPPNKGGQL
jgi:membrane fusion protein, multidrug efflux system